MDAVLLLFIPRALVDNLLNEEFLFTVYEHWFGRIEGVGWEEVVVVFFEECDLRRVKDRECIGCIR